MTTTAAPLTLEQGIILTGYTGTLLAPMSDYHKDAERRMGRPILSHEFGDQRTVGTLKAIYREDFLHLVSGMEAPK